MAGTALIVGNLTDGFFDAKIDSNYVPDRVYSAKDYSAIFDGVVSDGIFSTALDRFALSKTTELSFTIAAGRAWLNGHWIMLSSPFTYDYSSDFIRPGNGKSRTYAICIYYSDSGRAFTIRYFKADVDAESGTPWYNSEVMPNISKESEFDAVYTIGYVVLTKSNNGDLTSAVYSSIYSNLVQYSGTDYITTLKIYSNPTQKIFYATPYASALMDLEESVELRLSSIENKLSTAYARTEQFIASKSYYDNAYTWAWDYSVAKSRYELAWTYARAFNSSQAAYNSAYSWANAFISSKASYDDAYSKAMIAYSAVSGSIISDLASKMSTLWASRTKYDVAYSFANILFAGNLLETGIWDFDTLYSKVTSSISTSTATYVGAAVSTTLSTSSLGPVAWICFVQAAFGSTTTGPSIINARNIRLKATYHGGSTVWLGLQSVVAGANNLLANQTTFLNAAVLIDGFNGDWSTPLSKVELFARQVPAPTSYYDITAVLDLKPYGPMLPGE